MFGQTCGGKNDKDAQRIADGILDCGLHIGNTMFVFMTLLKRNKSQEVYKTTSQKFTDVLP